MIPFQTQFDNPLPVASDGIHLRAAKVEARVLALESSDAADVSSFNGRTGAVTLQLSDFSALGDARYVLKSGDVMSGTLNINTSSTSVAAIVANSYIETGFQFSHYQDTITNAAPVTAEFYHDTTAGTPLALNGSSIDFSMDSDTVKRRTGLRLGVSWTVAADATHTSRVRFFTKNSGSLVQALEFSATTFGAYGVAAVARPSVPDGSSLAVVIDALQALGLFAP